MEEPPITLSGNLKLKKNVSDVPGVPLRILLALALLSYLSYWLLLPFFSRILSFQHAKKIAPQSKGGV
jgi:hypothetical protein